MSAKTRRASRPRATELAERDARIVAMVRAGASLRATATAVGLSCARVGQITQAAGLALLERRRTGRTHGVSGYAGGCRCPTCRKANTERQRRTRAAAAPATEHGRAGYNYRGCRCEVCRAAKSAENRHFRALRAAARGGSTSG